jgi:hypothetical protein
MTLSEKLTKAFGSGHCISFENEIRRSDGEWYSRITWKHLQAGTGRIEMECKWFGFDTIEECVDDCLIYLDKIKKV